MAKRPDARERLLLAIGIGVLLALASGPTRAAQTIALSSPVPRQVSQRQGYLPANSTEHQPGGPALGAAEIGIKGMFPAVSGSVFDFRVVPLPNAFGSGTDWAPLEGKFTNEEFHGVARVPAGGWYRLEVRQFAEGKEVANALVEPIGVGEVFVIAGQSYAAGANDELTRVEDPQGRVVAFDVKTGKWDTANDPMPNVGDGGTIWPSLGNLLLPTLRVPIGFVNVAVGGTASRQWLPGETLYRNLLAAGKQTGSFRFVLWQQGESDVIEKVSTGTYVKNLAAIRGGLAKEWGFAPPWLLAKSTLHPTVYNDPDGEEAIRVGIERLSASEGFLPGPDTDLLAGENRGGPDTRRHFSGVGQRRAALLWFSSLWEALARETERAPLRNITIEKTPAGVRYGLFGREEGGPRPTLFLFTFEIEKMQGLVPYTEVGRRLAKFGVLSVIVDAPCHGPDRREGEPPQLQGWRHRIEKGENTIKEFTERVSAVLDHLVETGATDKDHVAACGTSRGGFLALHAAAADPRIRAVAAFSPVTDLLALREFKGMENDPLTLSLDIARQAAKLSGKEVWISIGNDDRRVDTDAAVTAARALVGETAKNSDGSLRAAHVELIVGANPGHAIIQNAHSRAAQWLFGPLFDIPVRGE